MGQGVKGFISTVLIVVISLLVGFVQAPKAYAENQEEEGEKGIQLIVGQASPQVAGTKIEWKVEVQGEDLQYVWHVYKEEKEIYSVYKGEAKLDWIPSEPGNYTIEVITKDSQGNEMTSQFHDYIINPKPVPLQIKSLAVDKKGPQKVGTKMRWTVEGEGEEVQYAWYIIKDGNEKNKEVIWYDSKNYLDWTPRDAGKYKIQVYAKDKEDKKATKLSEEYVIEGIPQTRNQKLEKFVNEKGLSSTTQYLMWVDISTQYTYVFKGKKGDWKLYRSMLCATGKDSTPTIKGTFKVGIRGSFFRFDGGIAKNYVQFKGNYLFHSVLFDPSGKRVIDSTLGKKASHGCVRLSVENSKWVYDNIPAGTTVYVN